MTHATRRGNATFGVLLVLIGVAIAILNAWHSTPVPAPNGPSERSMSTPSRMALKFDGPSTKR